MARNGYSTCRQDGHITHAERPELRHAGPTSVNREAELRAPSRVACSDLLGHGLVISLNQTLADSKRSVTEERLAASQLLVRASQRVRRPMLANLPDGQMVCLSI